MYWSTEQVYISWSLTSWQALQQIPSRNPFLPAAGSLYGPCIAAARQAKSQAGMGVLNEPVTFLKKASGLHCTATPGTGGNPEQHDTKKQPKSIET